MRRDTVDGCLFGIMMREVGGRRGGILIVIKGDRIFKDHQGSVNNAAMYSINF